jgi:hypothetical protein
MASVAVSTATAPVRQLSRGKRRPWTGEVNRQVHKALDLYDLSAVNLARRERRVKASTWLIAVYRKAFNVSPHSFLRLSASITSSFEHLARQWKSTLPSRGVPNGKRFGSEYVALNPRREDRWPGSFKLNLRIGRWAGFAVDAKGGDVVSLCAYLEGIKQREAARRLARMLGLEGGGRRHG